jgi:hypothetical protein
MAEISPHMHFQNNNTSIAGGGRCRHVSAVGVVAGRGGFKPESMTAPQQDPVLKRGNDYRQAISIEIAKKIGGGKNARRTGCCRPPGSPMPGKQKAGSTGKANRATRKRGCHCVSEQDLLILVNQLWNFI